MIMIIIYAYVLQKIPKDSQHTVQCTLLHSAQNEWFGTVSTKRKL